MSIHYSIATWNSSTAMEAREFRQVKRLPAALEETWKQIYNMCAADGLLASKRAWILLAEFQEFEKAMRTEHPLKGRHYFQWKFALRVDPAGVLDHVTFTAIRTRD